MPSILLPHFLSNYPFFTFFKRGSITQLGRGAVDSFLTLFGFRFAM